MAQRITSMIHSLFGTPASAARARPTAHAAGAGAAAADAELQPWLQAARTITAQAVPPVRKHQGQWVDLTADESAAEALRRWRIHTGFDGGNPAAVAGDEAGRRSTVRRVLEDGEPCWSKQFKPGARWQRAEVNERRMLMELGAVASLPELSPRDHAAYLVKAQRAAAADGRQPTAIAEFLTYDAGPSLDTWQLWSPCVLLPPHDLVLPLFAHPTFLAALVRRSLVALEAVSLFGFVHNDIKADNIALQLPADARASGACLRFTWNLRDLPLRLLDFEMGHTAGDRMPLLPASSATASPYACECHHRAAQMTDSVQRNAQLAGIDWGADLWSLGQTLRGWCANAEAMLALLRADVRSAVPDAALRDAAIDLLAQLQPGLAWLGGLAGRLQGHDRPRDDAANLALRVRDAGQMPHARLRAELEQAFTALSASARPPDWPVVMAMPDPAQPHWPPVPMPVPAAASAPARPAMAAALPAVPHLQDLAELALPGAPADLPSFIVIPHLGRVTLGRGDEAITADIRHRFAMGKTPITLGQWKRFWNAPDRHYTPVRTFKTYCTWADCQDEPDDHPVCCVNVADAEAYAHWFNRRFAWQLGAPVQAVGLPSELEWQLAARGGRLTQDYLWDDPAHETIYAQTDKSEGRHAPVAVHRPNGYGLHDVIGNVWEWTCSPAPRARSEIPVDGRDSAGALVARVVCGGSFNSSGWLRLSHRSNDRPGLRLGIGFRLVARIAP